MQVHHFPRVMYITTTLSKIIVNLPFLRKNVIYFLYCQNGAATYRFKL